MRYDIYICIYIYIRVSLGAKGLISEVDHFQYFNTYNTSKVYAISVIFCLQLRGSIKTSLNCSTFMFNDIQKHSGSL